MDTPPQTQPEPPARRTDPDVVLRGTDHLLGSLPHLLGYRPGRSVVVMASTPADGARSGLRRAVVRMTARLDLPAADDALDAVLGLLQPLSRLARDAGDGPVLLHTFVLEADEEVAAAVCAAVACLADEVGVVLHDLVLVRDGDYLALVAGGADDLDGQARWLPVPAPADVPAVADLVLMGRSVVDSREVVAAGVRHRDERAAAATALALELLGLAPETYDPVDALRRLGRWVVVGEDEPAPRDRARIVVALDDRWLRDAVMARWLPQLFTVEEVLAEDLAREVRRAVPPWPTRDAGALDRLLGLAARVPREQAVPLLTVAGAVAWGTGEGAIANEAVDLALETDASYTMAGLLRQALDRGIPPWVARAGAA